MKKTFRIYKRFVITNFKILKQSRVNLLIGIFTFILVQLINITLIELIYSKVPHINGFTRENILLLYGIFLIPRGIDHIISDYLWWFSGNGIRRGLFDKTLVRPIEPLFHIIIERFDFNGFSELILGLILLFTNIDLKSITLFSSFLFVLSLISAVFVYMSIKIVLTALAFWVTNSFFILEMSYSFSEFSRYPLDIFNKGIQNLILYILPFAFTAYIPYLILNNIKTKGAYMVFSLIGGYIMLFFAYKFWKLGERQYESTGS